MDDKREFGSSYLYAEDLLHGGKYHTAVVTISEVIEPNTVRAANGRLIDRYIVGFEGKEKRLVLCKTNKRLCVIVTGEQPEKWVGQRITLQVRIVKAFGSEVPAIRVLPPEGTLISKAIVEHMGRKAEWQPAND